MLQWNPQLLDENIAPGYSAFLEAEIIAVEAEFPQAQYWLANHFLNSALSARYRDGYRQAAVAFLRRTFEALAAYAQARELTLAFLARRKADSPQVSAYYSALNAWERFILMAQLALDLLRHLSANRTRFTAGDGSAQERVCTIANDLKHTRSRIANGALSQAKTVPIWLSNHGLEALTERLSFQECAELLRELCAVAEMLQNPSDRSA